MSTVKTDYELLVHGWTRDQENELKIENYAEDLTSIFINYYFPLKENLFPEPQDIQLAVINPDNFEIPNGCQVEKDKHDRVMRAVYGLVPINTNIQHNSWYLQLGLSREDREDRIAPIAIGVIPVDLIPNIDRFDRTNFHSTIDWKDEDHVELHLDTTTQEITWIHQQQNLDSTIFTKRCQLDNNQNITVCVLLPHIGDSVRISPVRFQF